VGRERRRGVGHGNRDERDFLLFKPCMERYRKGEKRITVQYSSW